MPDEPRSATTSATTVNDVPPFSQPLYPEPYVWFVLASALDVFLTFIVLELGGREVNKVAAWILDYFGLTGMTIFKFVMVTFVILLCQIIGRRNWKAGRRLAVWAVAITFFPVAFTLILLATSFR